MKKLVTGLILGLCCWAAATVSHAEKYALCVGINTYTASGCGDLNGCVNDSAYFYTNLVTRGGWSPANMTKLNDSKATKVAIRQAISNYAAKAKSGDVFVYQHSSHGGSGVLYAYNTGYKKAELAADLRSFPSGVTVVMVVDACYSGSLFKSRAALKAYLDNWDFAGEVSREMDAQRASAIARGVKGADKALDSSEIGWVTAASDSETSLDGGFYHSDEWLTNPSYGEEYYDEEDEEYHYPDDFAIGGVFLGSFTWSWWHGTGDKKNGFGDNDGYADAYECWKEGHDFCTNLDLFWEVDSSDPYYPYSYTPQCKNIDVLRSVELGWAGDEEPGGVRFASIPPQAATVGQTLNYTVSATNSDGSSGAIKYSVTSSTAPSGSFSVNATSGAFTFTPAADGVFSFTFVGTNSTAHTDGKATMTVTASLDAPSGLANSGVSSDSFTANWDTVPGATSYFLEVFAADASAAAKASDSAFELVTSEDGLTEGEYVILAENADNAMDNTCSDASSGYLSCKEVGVENDSVSTDEASVIWTLAGDASSCTLFNAAAGKFANPATVKAALGWSDTASGAWTLSVNDKVVSVANAADTSWKLQYNSGTPRFTTYKSTQKNLRFFRRDAASGAVFSADVGNVTSYTVTDLIPGDYTWRVRALGNDKGPFSEPLDVTLFSDPSAPPSIRPVADIEITVGETATATVVVSTPETAPVTSLTITAGDGAATLTDGLFSFAPAAPGVYPFTVTAVNANDSASVSFSVTATLAAPVAAEATEVGSDSFTANWAPVAGAQSYLLTVVEGAAAPSGNAVTDTLTAEGLGLGSSYGNGSCVSDASGAEYAAYAMKKSGGTAIQLNGKNGIGIVATVSAGKASAVRVSFDSSTKSGNTLDVYGSDTAYSSSDDLYSDSTAGTLLGSIEYNGSSSEGSLAITNSYAYVGLRSASGAIYLDTVEIDWNGSPAKATRAQGDLVLDAEDVGDATSYPVTGLSPLTHYSYFVAAKAGDILSSNSGTVELTTTDGPAAPAWSEIPAQSATAGVEFTFDLAPYVSGSPAPALSADVGTIAGTVLTWTPDAAGSVSIALTAENDSGTVETTLAVNVGLAAPVAADATNVGATSFTANWSAVAGAECYLLTVVEGKGAPSGDAVTDTLTADGLGLGSSYGDGSYVSTVSGAEYAAYAMKQSGGTAIQINSKNNIGIVTTVSGGSVSAIRVSFTGTAARTLNVYGSDTAYSSAADLYSDSTAGKLIGTIDYDGSTPEGSLAIDGSYAFVGFRSASGAIYLDSIEIGWNGSAKAARAEGDLVLDAEDVGNVTSYPVTGLSMLTHYSYTVAAKAGDVVSEASEAASLTTLESEVAPVWSDIPEQSATLGEPFVFDFAAYLVANPAATVTASAGTVDGNVLTFTPDAAGPTTVTLTAVNTLGSETATVVIVAVPAAPETVEPTVVSSNSFVATWLEVEGAQKYHLVVVEAASASSATRTAGDVVFEGDVTGTSREITGLAPETAYSYTVAAIVDGVAGPASEPVAVTTKAGPSAPAWSAIPAQNTYVGATFQLDLSAFLSGNPEPTVTADVGTVTGLNYVYTPDVTGPVTVTLTAANDSGTIQTTFVLTVAEAPTGGTHYAVVVGCNNYATGYASSLKGAVPDANHVYSLITTRGAWETANVTKLTDSAAKHDAIRAAISNAAANAVAGDTFLYFQSSHGGNWSYTFVTNDAPYADYPTIVYGLDPAGEDNFICSYNANYTAAEMAADLAAFDPAVNVVVMLDTCHSAGMFKYDTSRGVRRRAPAAGLLSASPDLFAEAVAAQLGTIRRARGIRAPSNVGFVTAADFNEYSWDSQDGNGGEFTTAFIDGVTNGVCDNAEYGDQDGWATFYEGWNYAKDIALGCVNDPEVDENGYALYDNTAYAEEYNEPDYYYDYNFTHAQITNEAVLRAVRVGYAGNPTLAAPVANPAEDVTDSSFTASWSSVADAAAYRLQVATDESFSTGTTSDKLLASAFTATSTTYTEFSGVGKDSGAVYAGRSSKTSDGAIQLNNSKSAGIWTTASGGNATRVAVEWNDATISGRSLNIYGSASALNSYSAASSATLIGTIACGTASALDITTPYPYIAIIPSGALYLDSVTIDWSAAGSESSIVFDQNVGKVTSHSVTGLEADTDYFYRVQALGGPVDSEFSNVISLTTDGGTPTAPAWDTIPPQTVAAGQDLVFDLNAYVSGSPKPTITADAGTVEAGVLTVSYAEAGEYTINLTASNSEGADTATLAVTVTAAPVTVPTLALSNPSSEGFDASWDACTGLSSYTLQIATDDQFSTGSAAGTVELFNNPATSATAPEGWTYAVDESTSKYLRLFTAEQYVISEAVSTKGMTSLTLSCKIRTVNGMTGTSDTALIEYSTDGTSWTELGTIQAASSTLSGKTLDVSACAGLASVRLRISDPGAESPKGIGLSNLVLSGEGSGGDGSLVKELTVEGTSTTVTGLEPETLYYARVKGASDWSEVQSIKTLADEPSAPDWLDIEPQTATVDLEFGIDLSIYVTGSPFPDITVDGEPTDGGAWVHTFDEAGTYTYTLLASNSIGTATGTLSVAVSEAPPAKYALCVGLVEFDPEFGDDLGTLVGAVNDATTLRNNLVERGGWAEADTTVLTNAAATKAAISEAIAGYAAKAKAGDTFVLQFSTHGGGDDEEGYDLAVYDNSYSDEDLAEDLLAFESGVKIVVLIDACHSAGMIARGAKAAPAPFAIAERVSALIDAGRAARKARGEDVARSISADEIGWVTAADFAENSQDGGYYDTDEWMSGDDTKGDVPGGVFLTSFTWGWWTGKADVSGTGDGDGWFDALEGWSFSGPVCDEAGHHPQFLHEDVLRSVELGWIGETAPSEAILFDPVPGVTVDIGEEAVLEGIVARNADGTTDGITLAIVDPTPEEADYTFADGKLTFTPDEDGLFLFTVRATSGRTSATKLLGITALLDAPVAKDATEVTDRSFTANWEGVAGAQAYELQVSSDPSFPDADPDILINEGFDGVTNNALLEAKGWTFDGTFAIYPTTGGEAAPSIKLDADGEKLVSPVFKMANAQNGIAFWVKGNPSGKDMTSTVTFEVFVGEEWQAFGEPFVPTTDSKGEPKEYEKIPVAATQARIVLTKLAGNVAIDDVRVVTAPADAVMVLDEDEIDAALTSYAVEGLMSGTTYYYRLRAIGANTKSAWSETIDVTTDGAAPIPVPDLTVMAPETSADTSLAAFWVCTGAAQFRLQVATDEAFATLVFDETMTEIAKTVTGLTPETTYYVRVCALDGERAGDWSEVQSITTAASGGDVPVQADIEAVTIDGTARTMKFAVPADAMVMTTTNLVTGPWVAYEGDVDGEGNVVIPLTGTAAFFRLGEPPSGD